MSFNLSNVNPSAFYKVRWYPKARNRQEYEEIQVEILGAINNNVQQPIRNGRVSVNGTQIKTLDEKNFKVAQEIFMINRWWTITDIQFDVTELAPQAQKYGTQHISTYLTIVSAE